MQISNITGAVQAAFTKAEYSPYEMSKVVSRLVGKQLPPQMFYTYCKKQYIKNVERRIRRTDAVEWTLSYINRNAGK